MVASSRINGSNSPIIGADRQDISALNGISNLSTRSKRMSGGKTDIGNYGEFGKERCYGTGCVERVITTVVPDRYE